VKTVRKSTAIGVAFAAVAVLAAAASTAPASDIYIWGKVAGRVAGKDVSRVDMTWAYKCLGDKLGAATYDWTLKVMRNRPLPRKTTTVGDGTSKKGSMIVTLTPGDYLPFSDPYHCETERGAGYDKPEIGAPFTVPDYCAWSVTSTRGAVRLEHGPAVKVAKAGTALVPGDALVTPKSGAASAASIGRDGSVALAARSRLEIDKTRCPKKGGWLLRLARGSVTVGVGAAARTSERYSVKTSNATASGSTKARWRVDFATGKTKVKALSGLVRVAGKKGSPVTLKAGQSTVVGR
jgi:hypothetical protein